MAKLACKTRGNSTPQGKERVYFACHSDDLRTYLDPICGELFATQNCAVYYNEEPTVPWQAETMEVELNRMQLLVIPVTTRFLYHPNEARDTELPFALAHHIPVLPLMQESGLEEGYQRVFGDLQYLDKNAAASDPTALPYDQKLARYLKSVLLGDELAAQVRGAFDAYIFLSYRKMDRKYAQELMRLIHQNDFCRDIAIWYDEFLVPGEDFNQAIVDAMAKSQLFTLVVTPNLVNEVNYVMTTEYPAAVEAGKPILPAEMIPTDPDALRAGYAGIPAPTDAHNAPALSAALLAHLRALAIAENDDDPKHLFFIGLAYLSGIDVEEDRPRGVRLIQTAAEQNLPEAMEKLSQMYQSGEGVARNYETAAQWLDRLAAWWEERFAATGAEKDGDELLRTLANAGDAWRYVWQVEHARVDYEKLLDVATQLMARGGEIQYRIALSASYCGMGEVCSLEGDQRGALSWYQKCVELLEQLKRWTGTMQVRWNLSLAYFRLGDLTETKNWYEKALELATQLIVETETVEVRRLLYGINSSMGDCCLNENDFSGARGCYDRMLQMAETLSQETGIEDFRLLCYNKIGNFCETVGDSFGAKVWYKQALELAEQCVCETGSVNARFIQCKICADLCLLCVMEDDLSAARDWCEKALELFEQLDRETGNIGARRGLFNLYDIMGYLCEEEDDLPGARCWYEKALKLGIQLSWDAGTEEDCRGLSAIYSELGDLCKAEGDLSGAQGWYEKALKLDEQLCYAAGTAEAYDDLATVYYNLGMISHGSPDYALLEQAEAIWSRLAEQCPEEESYRDSLNEVRDILAQR